MEKALVLAIIISVIYALLKFLEIKYLEKSKKPLRDIVRDVIFVFISSFVSSYTFIYYQNKIDDFFSAITNTNILKAENTQVFTGMPDF